MAFTFTGRKEPEKLSDLIRRYKEMVDVGILFKADHRSFTIGDGSLVLSFPISELMEIKDSEAGKVFAEFLYFLCIAAFTLISGCCAH